MQKSFDDASSRGNMDAEVDLEEKTTENRGIVGLGTNAKKKEAPVDARSS